LKGCLAIFKEFIGLGFSRYSRFFDLQLYYRFIKMSSVDNADTDTQSELTTLESGDTPTLPSDESPTIQALFQAHNDTAYKLALARIPTYHRIKLKGVHYVKYNPYRSKKSKRSAWYWHKDQAEELIRTSTGRYTHHFAFKY
jgi:hypothetical protein